MQWVENYWDFKCCEKPHISLSGNDWLHLAEVMGFQISEKYLSAGEKYLSAGKNICLLVKATIYALISWIFESHPNSLNASKLFCLYSQFETCCYGFQRSHNEWESDPNSNDFCSFCGDHRTFLYFLLSSSLRSGTRLLFICSSSPNIEFLVFSPYFQTFNSLPKAKKEN